MVSGTIDCTTAVQEEVVMKLNMGLEPFSIVPEYRDEQIEEHLFNKTSTCHVQGQIRILVGLKFDIRWDMSARSQVLRRYLRISSPRLASAPELASTTQNPMLVHTHLLKKILKNTVDTEHTTCTVKADHMTSGLPNYYLAQPQTIPQHVSTTLSSSRE
jgi:hypothetical protein